MNYRSLLICVLFGTASTTVLADDVPTVPIPNEKAPGARVVPDLGSNNTMRVLSTSFVKAKVGTDATISRDQASLTKFFETGSDARKLATERKLLPLEPRAQDLELLIASVWWECRVVGRSGGFAEPIKSATVNAILSEWVVVRFSSIPEGAEVRIDGIVIGKTNAKNRPARYLKPSEKYIIKMSKTGYKTHEESAYSPPKDGDDYHKELAKQPT